MMGTAGWPAAPSKERLFRSFDGGVAVRSRAIQPDRYAFFKPGPVSSKAIALGAGLSYAAAGFGGKTTSLDLAAFDRILDFDSQTGEVEVECGIALEKLFRFLTPRGFFLPVQPGHGRITVGGCIAADVHGKNQARDGTFISHLAALRLFHPRHGTVELAPQREPELFRATCGGFGLTGIIVSARLKTKRLPSTVLEFRTLPVSGLVASDEIMTRLAAESDFVYSWYDWAAPGSRRGRGYITAGKFLDAALSRQQAHPPPSATPLSAQWRALSPVPWLNTLTVPVMNLLYGLMRRREAQPGRLQLYHALFPLQGKEIYFRLFGRRGFHEYQLIIPHAALPEFAHELSGFVAKYPIAMALVSAKIFDGQSDLLRFSGKGICLAIDAPRSGSAPKFLEFLDLLGTRLAARPNIIKDSRLPRKVMEACFPEADKFRRLLRDFDPARTFQSELSARLGL